MRESDDSVLRVEHLVVEFPVGSNQRVHAVSDISFDVRQGETLGLVGESGCGKSTASRAIVGLVPPTGGRVLFRGQDLASISRDELRRIRPRLQMIFQNPIASLNPRRRVEDIVTEPLRIWGSRGRNRTRVAHDLLEAVGLDAEDVGQRRPHQLSGGQAQRVAIARSLVLEPDLVICDEPVSSLDVSVQAQILNLLEDMKARYGLTLLFIAHDLAVVRSVSDRVAVMYLGKLCEVGPPDLLFRNPAHPYTAALLAAVPVPDPDPDAIPAGPRAITGELPSSISPPSGCRFRTRCPQRHQRCTDEEPPLRRVSGDHFVACHYPLPRVRQRPAALGHSEDRA